MSSCAFSCTKCGRLVEEDIDLVVFLMKHDCVCQSCKSSKVNQGDRELLELAAKAVGYTPWGADFEGYPIFVIEGHPMAWNPLADDGDALRLAVRLQLSIGNEHVSAGVAYCTRGDDESFPMETSDESDADVVTEEDYVCTRRAIVRAAAQIWKSMP